MAMKQHKRFCGLLITVFLVTNVPTTYAAGRLGVALAPNLTWSGVYASPDKTNFSSPGVALRCKLGAIYDYPIRQDRYYISTGLFFAPQRIAVKNQNMSPDPDVQEKHALPYFQLPLLLKLYTSELKLDTQLYVSFGLLGKLRIGARNTELSSSRNKAFIQSFRRWGLAFSLGGGVEYNLGLFTSIFGGIHYQCDLTNVIDAVQSTSVTSSVSVIGHTQAVVVELGVRL